MPLPTLDFEMMFQRLRGRTYRKFHALRYRWSCVRAKHDLRYLKLFGRLRAKYSPEENVAYRLMWAVAIGGLLVVLLLDTGVIDPAMLYLPVDAGISSARSAA
ncbi:hypothetical protein [Herminiimonas arsenitoxidans]|uniref:hypothetical protein n=1 Tax=Herminiimonas arsenitoxidans TaxID=1809410 RepID=UPI000970C9CC|nr:hypothetical protein [Herminiimonas arsenitoxidans]